MLPNGPLQPDLIKLVAKDARSWMKAQRLTLRFVAGKLGISPAALSQFLNATYPGDSEKIARGVNELMEREARSAELPKPEGFVETEIARRVLLGVVRIAVDAGAIGVVTGPSGVGKTMCMEAAAKLYAGSIAIRVIQANRGMGIVRDLARPLGILRKKTTEIQRLVIEELQGTGRPLFFDEAQEFSEQGLKVIRDIHDCTGCPVLLFGTHDVKIKVDDSQMWYGQMASRIIASYDIAEDATDPKNPRPLFTVDEITAIFNSGKLRLADDGADYLTMLANCPGTGGLRTVKEVLFLASRHPKLRDKPLAAASLRQIVQKMHGAAFTETIRSRTEDLRLVKVG